MSKPSDMPSDERKRQYAALRRVIYKEASPALLAKFNLCPDAERFQMLKTWMVNPSLDNIHVEEKYHTWCENLRTDRYVTVTLFQLEKIYGKGKQAQEFIVSMSGRVRDKGAKEMLAKQLGQLQSPTLKSLCDGIPLILADMRTHNIRNCKELVS
ncbi:Cell surface glycoprotein 1 [Durusdinium trenchii]|uniref:Cell surface glycoprotein 1 n=1 Tax=Durusdinium trenchii TaxID=1381693 RepID=A0ABP0NJY8_9DINO